MAGPQRRGTGAAEGGGNDRAGGRGGDRRDRDNRRGGATDERNQYMERVVTINRSPSPSRSVWVAVHSMPSPS